MNTLRRFIKYIWIIAIISACGSAVLNKAYHDTTAHFNAYFYAKEGILEIEKQIYDGYEWNYNKVLPIFPQFDTTVSKGLEDLTENVVKMASIAIQRHANSKWEDDSYVLVGKARFYASEFPDAIETFKFVNKKGDDDDARHKALINLIRTFVEAGEINNAIAVSDYLKKERLNAENKFLLHLNRAYLFQKRDDMDQMVQNLVKAEEVMPNIADKARILFIIGQVYQDLGFEAEAYSRYERSLKSNPTYELSFYTKLNMASVTELSEGSDVKRVQKYFKKLLKDPKNLEYQDKIYYEMAGFELKNGNLDEAIENYKMSVNQSVKNVRQKSLSYLGLAKIYYDSLKNFPLAKSYYDSTISILPKDEDDYDAISQRQEVLSEFVQHITTVHKNDSLISLSYLPVDSVTALATAKVELAMENERERKRREKERARRMRENISSFDQEGGPLISSTMEGDTWYFYNPAILSRGSSEFRRVWGDRKLEDNWRRSIKAATVELTSEGRPAEQEVKESEEGSEEERMEAEIAKLLAQVPKSEDQIQKLLDEVELSLYSLGNIYNFKLEEKENAISSFEQLLSRFSTSEYRPEVLYQLYLLYKQQDQEELAQAKAEELKSSYPESIFAKLIDNPNYREESELATQQLQETYKKAYALYSAGDYKTTKSLIDSALSVHPENPFSDNLALLNAKAIGHIDGLYKYQFELNNFIKTYPESDVVEYAQMLLTASENYQINVFNSSQARFIEYFDQTHYLIVAYPNEAELSESITAHITDFLNQVETTYTSGNLILDEKIALMLVNDIPDRSTAADLLSELDNFDLHNKHKGKKIYTFIITKDNFDIFYQTKDLNAYLNFYDRKYQ